MSDLLKINVNDHTEKKNGLTYLSWAWAWAEVLKIDPKATWEAHEFWRPMEGSNMTAPMPCMFLPDGSAMVKVTATIKGDKKCCLLPVMDHRNKAIKNPDAFAINTAVMRCLAKAISMHGLGLYIYAGEDLPEVDDSTLEDKLKASIEVAKAKKRQTELDELAAQMVEWHQQGNDMDAIRVWYAPETFAADAETGNEERMYVWGQLKPESKLRSTIKASNPHHNKEHA
jgi:hypothetical protein